MYVIANPFPIFFCGHDSLLDKNYLVEEVRFELTDPFESSVFKTGAINRTLPLFLNWSIRQDSNLRFYSFADCCLGSLGH